MGCRGSGQLKNVEGDHERILGAHNRILEVLEMVPGFLVRVTWEFLWGF